VSCTEEKAPERPATDDRIGRARRILPASDVEGILFFGGANIRYLTGFTGTDAVLLLGAHHLALLVDGRYTTQAKEEARECAIVEFSDRADGVAGAIADLGMERVGIESAAVTLDSYLALRKRAPGVDFKPLSEEIDPLRIIKEGEEAALIREAARRAARALTETLEEIRPGVTEQEIVAILEMKMRWAGGEGPSFETIVASGPNAALPHAAPGSRAIEDGDFVTIDYGTVWEGYHSDETCTVAVGRVTERQAAVYRVVKEAHDRTIDAVREGISCREVDAVARGHIDRAGYGPHFAHGTGHGVGLEIHEPPRLSGRSNDILKEGMVVTVEPGIYLPGQWGVRIEDTVLVEKDGCEILTKMSKDLKIL
jgi:Xaa-Pro aminopeptidase/Xaa-Pro dipeptidase